MQGDNVQFRILTVLLFTSVVGACAHHGSTRDVNGVRIAEEQRGLWARTKVSPEAAMKTALKRVPGGRVTKGELEEEEGRLIYSFDIATPGKTGEDEVHVDAMTGAIVEVGHER